MKIAIAGAGSVGTYIGRDLAEAGHEVSLIEKNSELANRLAPELNVRWVVADACEVSSLQAAGVDAIDIFVAATGEDEDNLVMSLLAKQEFAVPRVISRVNHPENEWLFNESWGVDIAVSTPHLLTALIEEAVSVGSLVRLLQFEGGATRLIEVTLADGSPAINKSIAELNLPRDGTIVALVRQDHVIRPHGDTVVQVGDEVLALVNTSVEHEMKAALVGATTPPIHLR